MVPGCRDVSWTEYWFTLGTLDTGGEVNPNCPGLIPYMTVNVSFLVSSTEVKDHVMVTVFSVELEIITSGRRGKFSPVAKNNNYDVIVCAEFHSESFPQALLLRLRTSLIQTLVIWAPPSTGQLVLSLLC